MKKISFYELENTLTRTEMKKIKAGSGNNNCFACLGGVDCHPAGPGVLGWTGCDDSSGTSCKPGGSTCRG